MQQITLLYHDVIENSRYLSSGFSNPKAWRYKLEASDFVRHMNAVAAVLENPPITVYDLQKPHNTAPVMIGFDDGGLSGITIIASEFNRRRWPAHFFIPTDFIGQPGFLNESQLRELDEAGHVIGSHSCSHPNPMNTCSEQDLLNEWTGSVTRLSDILGHPVDVASIPGGAYGKNVAQTAYRAGIRQLFTSEPVQQTWQVEGCRILGRFGIEREDSPAKAAAIASGKPLIRIREYTAWNIKRLIKQIASPLLRLLPKQP